MKTRRFSAIAKKVILLSLVASFLWVSVPKSEASSRLDLPEPPPPQPTEPTQPTTTPTTVEVPLENKIPTREGGGSTSTTIPGTQPPVTTPGQLTPLQITQNYMEESGYFEQRLTQLLPLSTSTPSEWTNWLNLQSQLNAFIADLMTQLRVDISPLYDGYASRKFSSPVRIVSYSGDTPQVKSYPLDQVESSLNRTVGNALSSAAKRELAMIAVLTAEIVYMSTSQPNQLAKLKNLEAQRATYISRLDARI